MIKKHYQISNKHKRRINKTLGKMIAKKYNIVYIEPTLANKVRTQVKILGESFKTLSKTLSNAFKKDKVRKR